MTVMWTGEKGRREETNKREREAGCQVLPLRRELTKMQLSTPSSMYSDTENQWAQAALQWERPSISLKCHFKPPLASRKVATSIPHHFFAFFVSSWAICSWSHRSGESKHKRLINCFLPGNPDVAPAGRGASWWHILQCQRWHARPHGSQHHHGHPTAPQHPGAAAHILLTCPQTPTGQTILFSIPVTNIWSCWVLFGKQDHFISFWVAPAGANGLKCCSLSSCWCHQSGEELICPTPHGCPRHQALALLHLSPTIPALHPHIKMFLKFILLPKETKINLTKLVSKHKFANVVRPRKAELKSSDLVENHVVISDWLSKEEMRDRWKREITILKYYS